MDDVYELIVYDNPFVELYVIYNIFDKIFSDEDSEISYKILMEIHKAGKSVVHVGSKEECELKQKILSEIKIESDINSI
jgi:ATP-dependent Clp protease adapter protein ClpS